MKSQIRLAAGERLEELWDHSSFAATPSSAASTPKIRRRSCRRRGASPRFAFRAGPGIRVDTAAYADAVVPPYYDSLVAKLIAHGRDRAEAIARMHGALDGFVVEGIKTTIPLHKRILAEPDFIAGKFDTHFLDRLTAARKVMSVGINSSPLSRRAVTSEQRLFPAALRDPRSRACTARRLSTSRDTLADAGVQLIQLRDKRAPAATIFAQAKELAALLAPRGVRFIVNDRPDIAAMSGAGGVHVGQEDFARRGCAADLQRAALGGRFDTQSGAIARGRPHFGGLYCRGPIFPTGTKENPDPVVGIDFLRAARQMTRKPLVAIGGITLESAADVFRAGADSVAVIRDLAGRARSRQSARANIWPSQNACDARA